MSTYSAEALGAYEKSVQGGGAAFSRNRYALGSEAYADVSVERLFKRVRRGPKRPPRRLRSLQRQNADRLSRVPAHRQSQSNVQEHDDTSKEETKHDLRALNMVRLKQLARPLSHKRRKKAPEDFEAPTAIDVLVMHAAQQPGPAAYDTRCALGEGVGALRFGKANEVSALDAMLAAKAAVPSPLDTAGASIVNGGISGNNGSAVFWGSPEAAASLSEGERALRRARLEPSPAQYAPKLQPLHGGQIVIAQDVGAGAKSDTELSMLRASQIPGPGEYTLPAHEVKVAKWSKKSAPSEIDNVQRRARALPGPAAYGYASACSGDASTNAPGFSFEKATNSSSLDIVMRRAALVPGPSCPRKSLNTTLSGGRIYRMKRKGRKRGLSGTKQ